MSTNTYVSVHHSKVLEEHPEPLKIAVQYALLENESIADRVVASNIQSLAFKANRAYAYGQTGDYPLGLPTATIVDAKIKLIDAEAVIEEDNPPYQVHVIDAFASNPVTDFLVFTHLQDNYGWSFDTNIISVGWDIGDYITYTVDVNSEVDYESGSVTSWFEATVSYLLDGVIYYLPPLVLISPEYLAHAIYVVIPPFSAYSLVTPDLITPKDNKLIKDNQMLSYSPNGAIVESWRLYVFRDSDDAILFDSGEVTGDTLQLNATGLASTYEPVTVKLYWKIAGLWNNIAHPFNNYINKIVYWTHSAYDAAHPELSPAYSEEFTEGYFPIVSLRHNKINAYDDTDPTNYEGGKKMLKYFTLVMDDMVDSINDSPDIEYIDDAYFNLSINVTLDTPEVNKYLYEFFSKISLVSTASETDYYDAIAENERVTTVYNSINVAEGDYNSKISYSYISLETSSGVLPDNAKYTQSITVLDRFVPPPEPTGDDGVGTGTYVNADELVLKKQVGVNTITTMTVKGLHQETIINGRLTSAFLRDTDQLLIPLGYDTLDGIFDSIKDRETFLYDCMYISIYTIQTVHLEWYQTSIFSFLLQVVAIVLILPSLGTSLFAEFAISVYAGVMFVIQVLALSVVVDYAVEWLLKSIDGILGDVLAILVIMLAGKFGGAGNYFQSGMSLADTMLQLVDIFVQVQGSKDKLKMENLQYEVDKFTADYEKREEELEDIKELLSSNNPLTNPLYMLNSPSQTFTAYDTPQAFYDMHIHNTNPAIKTLDIIENYTAALLTLPRVDQLELKTEHYNAHR